MKRARQSQERRVRNMSRKTRVKHVVKAVRLAVEQNQPEQAREALQKAIPVIDRAAARGAIHWRTAARKISRLTHQVNALTAAS